MIEFAEIEREINNVRNNPQSVQDPASHLLSLAEQVLENWIEGQGLDPTHEKREGFRLLALHRQGAKNNPSFHACRETCRELIYQVNLYHMRHDYQQIAITAMVAMHLLLFIRGKMEIQDLGEFCCSSKTLRTSQLDQ